MHLLFVRRVLKKSIRASIVSKSYRRFSSTTSYTNIAAIPSIISSTRSTFKSGKTLSYEFRLQQLKNLYEGVAKYRQEIVAALQKDYGYRSPHEIKISEIVLTQNEIAAQINELSDNMANESMPLRMEKRLMGDEAFYCKIPFGNALIMSPWNFPFLLTLSPLAGAIAAGNTAIIKPSEITQNTSNMMETIMNEFLDQDCYKIIHGGVEETTELLTHEFDVIFFTGSPAVGKIVHQAAAKHLTPTILELGGKNPVVVDNTADIEAAAKKIAFGRFFHEGQICVAAEYVLCDKVIQDQLIEALKRNILTMFGSDATNSDSWGRIVNENNYKRLCKILDENKENIVFGGENKKMNGEDEYYVSPTILSNVDESNSIMNDEVFGPILSIYPLDDIEDAIEVINSKPKGLAAYIFSESQPFVDKVLRHTDSGAVCVNDCIWQTTYEEIPFGGVGMSGHGVYHGVHTFNAFTHKKPVLVKGRNFVAKQASKLLVPPWTEKDVDLFEKAVKITPKK